MRRLMMLLVMLFICGTASALDVMVGSRYLVPQYKGFYAPSPGANLQFNQWFGDHLGIGVSGGWERWGTVGDPKQVPNNIRTGMVTIDNEGANEIWNVGAHLLLKFASEDPYKEADWIVSVGAVYMMPDPGQNSTMYYHEGDVWGYTFESTFDVELEDSLVIEVAVLKERVFGTPFAFGVGYRRTVEGGGIKVEGLGIDGQQDVDAIFAELTLPIKF